MKPIYITFTAVLLTAMTACSNAPKAAEMTLPSAAINNQGQVNTTTVINQHAIAQAVTRVADLSKLPDDSMVRLKGKLVRALRDDHYEFSDGTGSVVVEIDHELWQGRAVNVSDTITLIGELDKELNPLSRLTVDVQLIEF